MSASTCCHSSVPGSVYSVTSMKQVPFAWVTWVASPATMTMHLVSSFSLMLIMMLLCRNDAASATHLCIMHVTCCNAACCRPSCSNLIASEPMIIYEHICMHNLLFQNALPCNACTAYHHKRIKSAHLSWHLHHFSC